MDGVFPNDRAFLILSVADLGLERESSLAASSGFTLSISGRYFGGPPSRSAKEALYNYHYSDQTKCPNIYIYYIITFYVSLAIASLYAGF